MRTQFFKFLNHNISRSIGAVSGLNDIGAPEVVLGDGGTVFGH